MTKPTKAQLAAKYAGWGWRVFPIVPGTKDRPMVKWGSEASADPAVVARWWQRAPEANIGVACGQSGLAVVDLDNKKGKEGSKRWDELALDHGEPPETLTARTPTGGFHLYYRGEVANTVSRLADGVDTRGSGGMGGYVLAPGSTVEGVGDYEFVGRARRVAELPSWVREKAGERREDRSQRTDIEVEELDTDQVIRWARHYLEHDARPAVEGDGGNNRAFYVACVLRDRGVSEGTSAELMAELYNPRCEPPWSLEEIARFARNAWEYAGVVGPGGDSAESHFGGADDWGKAGEPPSIEEFFERGARPLVEPELTQRNPAQVRPGDEDHVSFRDAWVWVVQQKMFMRRRDKFTLDKDAFDSMYGYLGEKGKVSGMILSSNGMMRKFETLAFLPGRDEFSGNVYNMWVRPAIEPREGDTAVFDEHMLKLLPVDSERAAALDWMAWVLQNETLKPNFAFLMQGEQGCGKSWLGVLMSKLVDERNTTFLRTEDVGNRFNSWILRTRLAVVEELMGDDKRALANRMKALITQETVTVEIKGKDLLTTPNSAAFMAFTNHPDALRLENKDRRYLIFRTRARGEGTPIEYWTRLWGFLRSDAGPRAALHQLLTRPVPVQFGLGRAPFTAAHEEMRQEGLPELERWLLENFEDRNAPFDQDLVSAGDVEAALPERLRRGQGVTKPIVAFLRDVAGGAFLGPHRIPGGSSSKRLWAIRRGELYQQMTHAGRVERYLKAMSSPPPRAGGSVDDDFNDDAAGEADRLPDPLA